MPASKTRKGTRTAHFSLGLICLTTLVLVTGDVSATPHSLKARFQSELDRIVAQYELPGATAAYTLADGTTVAVAAGLADVATEQPMQPDSRMLAASIGKTFVGAVMLSLDQEGRLDLDDHLSLWLGDKPWFSRLPNHDAITLRQLLRHESGLPDHVKIAAFPSAWQQRRQDGDTPFEPEELIAFVLDQSPLFPAGDAWSYSDTGYLLLGLVIEAASGCTYYATVTDRFLTPLGLEATRPQDHLELPGLATGYVSQDNELGLPPATTRSPGVLAWHPGLEWTGGGLVSNSGDLARWAWVLFSGRGLQEPYLEELLQGRPIDTHPNGPRYGLGVGIHPQGLLGPTWGHGGWIPGYVSNLRYYPDRGIAVAFQVNTDIGMIGSADRIGEDMETRLARIVLSFENDED